MRNPPEPPAPPGEPYLPARTPRTGTLLGLPNPLLLSRSSAQARAHESPEAEVARHLAGLRLELAGFREWLPGVLGAGARPLPAAVAAPAPPPLPGLGGRRRALAPQLLIAGAGAVLAVALMFASASAALNWPAYARLVGSLGGDSHSR